MSRDEAWERAAFFDGALAMDMAGRRKRMDYECDRCRDTGKFAYPDSAMGMGIGGQMITEGPCPGTKRRPDMTDCPIVLRERENE